MHTPSGHVRRALAVGAAALAGLGVLLLPSGARAAISTQAFCTNVPSGQSGFTDIGNTAPHTRNIECLKGSGVTAGVTATTYAPQAIVRRGQMATFVANMIDRANGLDTPGAPNLPDLPTAAASQDRFTDDEASVHEANINRLAQANIISGQTTTTFNPEGEVSRAQMATFIAEALEFLRGAPLPEGNDAFTDDETSNHEANINRLATADIVDGTSAAGFSPENRVTRAQMASFIVQALADLNADGFITPIPVVVPRLTVNPAAGAAQAVVAVTTDNTTDVASDNRTYTATGLDNTKTYRITIFQSSQITNPTADASFADTTPNDNVADQGTPVSQIISVNGTARPAGTTTTGGVTPANGTITFVLDATAVNGRDNPVIFLEGGATTNLDVDASDHPTEAFGIGGTLVTTPPEGSLGEAPGAAALAEPGLDLFTTATDAFNYDSNDIFQVRGAGVSQAQFELVLTAGDTVGGAYNPDPAGVSTLNITTDAPSPAPTNVVATVVNRDNEATINDITVTWTIAPGTSPGATFQVQRATVTGPCNANNPIVGSFSDQGIAVSGTTFTQDDVANGCYVYQVIAVNPLTDVESDPSEPSAPVTVPGTAPTTTSSTSSTTSSTSSTTSTTAAGAN
jgi:hypothetical protein